MQETTFPVGLLVHDDCSTDGTAEIIAAYQSRYPLQITTILQMENQRSKGRKALPIILGRASGKYIAICEGDDYWTDPGKLQKQVDLLEAHPEYVGCFHTVRVEKRLATGEVIEEVSGQSRPELSIGDLLRANSIATCSVVVRRECLPIRLPQRFDRSVMGDWPRWIFAALQGRWAYIPDMMGTYVVHGGGAWSGLSRTEQSKGMICMLEDMCEELPPQYLDSIHVGFLEHCHSLGIHAFKNEDDDALQWLRAKLAHRESRIRPSLYSKFQARLAAEIATLILQKDHESPPANMIAETRAFLARLVGRDQVDNRVTETLRSHLSDELLNIGNAFYVRNDRATARKLYGHALSTRPWRLRALAYCALVRMGDAGSALRDLAKAVGTQIRGIF